MYLGLGKLFPAEVARRRLIQATMSAVARGPTGTGEADRQVRGLLLGLDLVFAALYSARPMGQEGAWRATYDIDQMAWLSGSASHAKAAG